MHSTDHAVACVGRLSGWRTSSYSGGSGAECLEVGVGHPHIPVRDSKAPHGPVVTFSAPHWAAFVAAVADGQLDI
ncbi:DUF397 domain-containing protein [Streptomyces sp. NBC_00111]|uniref:DUF397 domain-containing protein n=1 Tax=unclassified Streptomyces TaxID=2593676 RepID=UPI003254DE07